MYWVIGAFLMRLLEHVLGQVSGAFLLGLLILRKSHACSGCRWPELEQLTLEFIMEGKGV